jgi:hypothetical protein
MSLLNINEKSDTSENYLKGKKISASISFVKAGMCMERILVCAVKSTTLSSTVKVYEPVDQAVTKKSGGFAKIFNKVSGAKETMRVYKVYRYLIPGILHTHGI